MTTERINSSNIKWLAGNEIQDAIDLFVVKYFNFRIADIPKLKIDSMWRGVRNVEHERNKIIYEKWKNLN